MLYAIELLQHFLLVCHNGYQENTIGLQGGQFFSLLQGIYSCFDLLFSLLEQILSLLHAASLIPTIT